MNQSINHNQKHIYILPHVTESESEAHNGRD